MPPIGLPLRHEEDVDGLVASVFLDIRRRMPFVPALFKVLADDPEALLAAWLQARMVYDDPKAPALATRIRVSARTEIDYRPTSAVRRTLAPFVAELPFMLLIVSSLQLSLDGELELRPAPRAELPEPGPVPEPEFSDRGEHPIFAEICEVYGTRHLPSIFRSLAATGTLEEVWSRVGPFLTSPRGTAAIGRVERVAGDCARALPEAASFDVEGARSVLEQFRRALPRNLIVAAAGSRGEPT